MERDSPSLDKIIIVTQQTFYMWNLKGSLTKTGFVGDLFGAGLMRKDWGQFVLNLLKINHSSWSHWALGFSIPQPYLSGKRGTAVSGQPGVMTKNNKKQAA